MLADFLARLHMEFLVDPLDLELRLLVLTGEIADARTYAHLAKEFGAEVVELFTDPVTSVPVAHRRPARAEQLDRDPSRDAASGATVPESHRTKEVSPRSRWCTTGTVRWPASGSGPAMSGRHRRDGSVAAPTHTVGDLVLLRGRWLSVAALTKALRAIDGISTWQLRIRRAGTLDAATVTVSFNRESLVTNQMWRGRIEQALSALTPVSIAIEVAPDVVEEVTPPSVVDERGIHLG